MLLCSSSMAVRAPCAPTVSRASFARNMARCAQRLSRRSVQPRAGAENVTEAKSDEYTDVMRERMGSAALTYRHEDGMNYTRILDDLIVGSCLQMAEDVDRIADTEGVRTVLQLQEDSDMAYFSLDLAPITERVAARGDMTHLRHRIRDFDPFSLRMELPAAVALLARNAEQQGGTAYVHCTAGLGRAPAVALAWMWWYKGVQLEDAYELLTGLRPCKPKTAAIRAAAADVLFGAAHTRVTLALRRWGGAESVSVAGLDIGWGQQVPLALDRHWRYSTTRHLPAGSYQYKFIMDGHWTYCVDHPTTLDGDNLNNFVVVPFVHPDPSVHAARDRIMADGGQLSAEEAAAIRAHLESWPGVGQGGGTTGRLNPQPQPLAV